MKSLLCGLTLIVSIPALALDEAVLCEQIEGNKAEVLMERSSSQGDISINTGYVHSDHFEEFKAFNYKLSLKAYDFYHGIYDLKLTNKNTGMDIIIIENTGGLDSQGVERISYEQDDVSITCYYGTRARIEELIQE